MEESNREDQKSSFTQMQTKLQNELENYTKDKELFSSYLETMKKVDLWLEKGDKE